MRLPRRVSSSIELRYSYDDKELPFVGLIRVDGHS